MEKFVKEPCHDKLTDEEYLIHMIPHHQVAVDISIMHQKKTKSPRMQNILRKLIWVQKYEIDMMNHMLVTMPNKDMSHDHLKMNRVYQMTVFDSVPPNKIGLTKTYCDPHFFDPKGHMEHMKHMKLDDVTYMKHMIPHHQVAVDMSKKLLKHTNNDFMIYLCYRIIQSQQAEIIQLQDMLKNNNYDYPSQLIH